MASRRSRHGNPSSGPEISRRRPRGSVTVQLKLPRFVIAKVLTTGRTSFYFNVPTLYRRIGCPIRNQPLGADYVVACGEDGAGGRAASLNSLFDEWTAARQGKPISGPAGTTFGTVKWLFTQYRTSKAYLEKVSARSRPDYERTMQMVEEIRTKKGDRISDRSVRSISPVSADKLYEILLAGPNGDRPRQAEKAVALCRRAWRVVHRLYPREFNSAVPNPWDGVTIKRRIKGKKSAVTREQVYTFAQGAIELGKPEAAAAAVVCFEWLQRPENVLAGVLRWSDYRSEAFPTAIKIIHHKTGAVVWHPLQDEDGTLFYRDAEIVLSKLPKRGLPLILREIQSANGVAYKPYSFGGFEKIIQQLRKVIGLPSHFTLDACRHGGMTEIEEAELTEGQGRALSGHKTAQAYRGYAKETFDRALAATRKRHAHLIANALGTSIQNEREIGVQNETGTEPKTTAK